MPMPEAYAAAFSRWERSHEHLPECEDGVWYRCGEGQHLMPANSTGPRNWCHEHSLPTRLTVDCACEVIMPIHTCSWEQHWELT